MSYSISLPSYSIGKDAYSEIAKCCRPYGTKAVAIGGKKAMAAAKDAILDAIKESDIEILDFLWYGGECTFENVEKLENNPIVKEADMIFAIGGGKATDTSKATGVRMNKPVFSFPTIASNCSACTSVSIMYNEDGSFKQPFFFEKPPVHAFINTQIIVESPVRYLWAGMGDTYAKYFESSVSSRNEEVPHYIASGVASSRMCYEPILKYGIKALESNKSQTVSAEFEQAVLAVIVSTAIASIFLCTDHIIDYNTGLAHAIFYALTSFPVIEKNHLHGEVVSYGVLALLLVDGNDTDFKRVYEFSKQAGLPTKLEALEIPAEQLDKVAQMAVAMKDIDHNPYKITKDMLACALRKLEAMQ